MKLTTKESRSFIQSRRSVFPKAYESDEVSDNELKELLEMAKWAPTHKNTQPWHFIVFRGEALMKLIDFKIELSLKKNENAPEIAAKEEKMKLKARQSAALIAIVMKRDKQERVPVFEEEWSVACAVQNMHLHAASLNLGCYWSTGGFSNHSEMKQYLNLEEKDRHMGWFFVGRFDRKAELAKDRNPISEYTEWRS